MTDTPTHRAHILQVRMQQAVEWTKKLQSQRAEIVERIVRVKSNSKIARSIQVHTSLERTLARIDRHLLSTENALNKITDDLNKCRGLFLELSDFELVLEPLETVHGNNAESSRDRGTVSQGTNGPTHHTGALHASRAPESAASAIDGNSHDVQLDAGHGAEPDRHDGRA